MDVIGKSLIAFGILLTVVGAIMLFAGKVPWLGRLPGDIQVEGKHYTIYFPIVTCLLLSVLLSLVFWIVSRFRS
jgi:hypothetical protein